MMGPTHPTMNRVFWMVDYDGKSWTAIRGDLTDDADEMRAVAGLPDDAPIESKVEHFAFLSKGTLDDLRAEIAKCEVVCANCHRIRTKGRSPATRGRSRR